MTVLDQVKQVLAAVLRLDSRRNRLETATPLFGNVPELDSMAIVSVIATLAERFDIVINDDEITADTFATVGSLSQFIERKLQQRGLKEA